MESKNDVCSKARQSKMAASEIRRKQAQETDPEWSGPRRMKSNTKSKLTKEKRLKARKLERQARKKERNARKKK